jgi:hypothetical protein
MGAVQLERERRTEGGANKIIAAAVLFKYAPASIPFFPNTIHGIPLCCCKFDCH